MDSVYEDQLTIFIDFLGFSEASVQLDENAQTKLLGLLKAIASMRTEFFDKTGQVPGSEAHAIRIQPTITTFSDHIVASYPIERILPVFDDDGRLCVVLSLATRLVAKIAAAALLSGFLIRGGLSYGKLYHVSGVVFGAAMVGAYNLE